MDSRHFDALTRALTGAGTRRGALGLLATLPILGKLFFPRDLEARKKRKKRKKKKRKVRFNAFGCVDVGKFCKTASQCCSGICQGKKGKKTCRAHDASTCPTGQHACGGNAAECKTGSGQQGFCDTTTGNAPYCAGDGTCFQCSKDADCTGLCGANAACVTCNRCAFTGGMACVGSEPDSCQEAPCPSGSICSPCGRDLDCVPLCGEGALCIPCTGCPAGACVGQNPDSCIA